MNCIVCKCETRKYKCPKCLEFYCSSQCYGEHKKQQDNCIKIIDQDLPINNCEKVIIPFRTEDTVSPDQLQELRHSSELKNLLNNIHLRNLLKEVDDAPDAWRAMKLAMQEPLFTEFADVCLKIVEPCNTDESE